MSTVSFLIRAFIKIQRRNEKIQSCRIWFYANQHTISKSSMLISIELHRCLSRQSHPALARSLARSHIHSFSSRPIWFTFNTFIQRFWHKFNRQHGQMLVVPQKQLKKKHFDSMRTKIRIFVCLFVCIRCTITITMQRIVHRTWKFCVCMVYSKHVHGEIW